MPLGGHFGGRLVPWDGSSSQAKLRMSLGLGLPSQTRLWAAVGQGGCWLLLLFFF